MSTMINIRRDSLKSWPMSRTPILCMQHAIMAPDLWSQVGLDHYVIVKIGLEVVRIVLRFKMGTKLGGSHRGTYYSSAKF